MVLGAGTSPCSGSSFAAAPALLLRQILTAADVHLTAGHDLGYVWFEPHGP